MTYGYIVSVNGDKPKRLEEYPKEMQEKIKKASYAAGVRALGYKVHTA